MTPGTYIAKRRASSGRSLDAVALCFDTDPPVSARSRAEWLAQIEADALPVPAGFADALAGVIAFDPAVLTRLVAVHEGRPLPAPHVCADCGCSWEDPCIDAHGRACSWTSIHSDRCTACAAPVALAVEQAA